MKLLRFPFLVQKGVVEQLELFEVFVLSTLSNYSKTNISSCLRHYRFKVVYDSTGLIRVGKIYSNKPVLYTLIVSLNDQSQQEFVNSYQFWTLLNREFVSVNILEVDDSLPMIATYWPSIFEVKLEMLSFIVELFSKSILHLQLYDAETIPNTMNLVNKLKLEELIVVVSHTAGSEKESHDELVRKALDECRDVGTLGIRCKTSASFEYDFELPFDVKIVAFDHAHWVTKDQVVNHFLKCDIVELEEKHFDDQELSEIFEEWTIQPKTKCLIFEGIEDFYSTSSLTNVVGHFPGARAVRKAQIPSEGTYEVLKFKEGRGYVIRATNGTEALVAMFFDQVILQVNFQANDNIDKMNADYEEPEDDVEGNQNNAIDDDNANDERNNNN